MTENKKTKVLICGILPPPNFGHSVMYRMLMDSSFPEHFDITFLDMKFWSYGKHKKVTVGKLLKMIKYWFQFVWLLITRRPDYVLYNMSFYKMPFLKDFFFCLTGNVFGAKIIIHDFGQYIKELHDTSGAFIRGALKQYMKITTASIIMGEHTREKYEGFLRPDQLYVVSGCARDTWDLFDGRRDEFKDVEYIDVLYFSFVSELKGARVAFKAVEQIFKQRNDIRFTFAGPAESEEIEEEMKELSGKYPKLVKYLGYIEGDETRTKLFRRADVFIFPTLRDVFGLVLLHAMAEGVPIISSVEGCIPEIIRDKIDGYLIPKGDWRQLAERISRLASDGQLRKNMGEANRQRYLDTYSPSKYGARMIDVFTKIGALK